MSSPNHSEPRPVVRWSVVAAFFNVLAAMITLAVLPPFHRVDLALWAVVWAWWITSGCLLVSTARRPRHE